MPLIAYAFVHWMSCLKKRSQKLLWLIAAFGFVWLSGTFVYWRADWSQNGYSTRNPNLQEQMELCLVLDALEGEKTVIADDDFLPCFARCPEAFIFCMEQISARTVPIRKKLKSCMIP